MTVLSETWIRTFVTAQCTYDLDEDAMGLDWVAFQIREDFGDVEDAVLMEQTLRVVRAMLAIGMTARNPPFGPNGYQPWPDQHPDAVLARIRAEWQARGEAPGIQDAPWFGPPPPPGSQ